MANVTYTVVKGDTLSELAVKFNTTVKKLVELNDITNPDYIVVGQVLIISGTATTTKKTTTSRATIKAFGLQSNTDRTMYATWTWTKSYTENYQVIWYYATGDGIWFIGEDTTTAAKQSLYTAPNNATKVKFKVKPISKKHTVNKKEVSYWTANWSTEKTYNFSNNPPSTPEVPTVTIKDYTLTAELSNIDANATEIQFQVVKNNTSTFKTGKSTIKTSYASYSCKVAVGNNYKVRCRAIKKGEYSAWSEYSDNVGTMPAASEGITTIRALSETSVYLEWQGVDNAKNYAVEYTTDSSYFDSSKEVQSMTVESVVTHAEVTGLESGKTWYFRVRAINDEGNSPWTGVQSLTIGEPPAAPTTWSSTTTVVAGENLTLYWVHNAEDGSNQSKAEIRIVNSVSGTTVVEFDDPASEDDENKTNSYVVDTSSYVEGTKIEWAVRTAGITGEYGEWSVSRKVDVYGPVTLSLRLTHINGEPMDVVDYFPICISASADPKTQSPIGYYIAIIANETYETVDDIGNVKMVNENDTIYSKFFDAESPKIHQGTTDDGDIVIDMLPDRYSPTLMLSANEVNLDNNISYTIICTVSMDSGLTATESVDFTVAWSDDMEYEPNAEISIDSETLTASIRPYCNDENDVPIEDISLAVYRREFDGTFTELVTGIDNTKNTFITDPHPALDYARYRIVATNNSTGAVSYCDVAGYPVGEKSVVIQWDEDWTSFDVYNEDALEQPVWSGSMLKLPYNIDVADSYSADVALIEYIGRKHPVSYYGTQVGETSTWTVAIDKKDEEMLYALRRLAVWRGDVYVREPSGSGYWANIKVSFTQTHCVLTVPVTLSITRVEGGI